MILMRRRRWIDSSSARKFPRSQSCRTIPDAGPSGIPTVERVDVVGAFETARISRGLQTDTPAHRLQLSGMLLHSIHATSFSTMVSRYRGP